VAKIIERLEACYEVQEVKFGTVYKWRPESVLIVCECGETEALTDSDSTCEECGAEHQRLVRGDLTGHRLERDEEVHPWRYFRKSDDETSLPF
jgi:hypothetical protein